MCAALDRASRLSFGAGRSGAHSVASGLLAGLVTVARVAAGVLWLLEGILKYRAGFGAADIQLVVDSAVANSRVPGFFVAFAEGVLAPFNGPFGVLIPALEVGLGIMLIVGLVTVPVAALSIAQLMLYWLADQLAPQYPILVVLAALLLLFPAAAQRLSLSRFASPWQKRGAFNSVPR